jgi:hypothetical protein
MRIPPSVSSVTDGGRLIWSINAESDNPNLGSTTALLSNNPVTTLQCRDSRSVNGIHSPSGSYSVIWGRSPLGQKVQEGRQIHDLRNFGWTYSGPTASAMNSEQVVLQELQILIRSEPPSQFAPQYPCWKSDPPQRQTHFRKRNLPKPILFQSILLPPETDVEFTG